MRPPISAPRPAAIAFELNAPRNDTKSDAEAEVLRPDGQRHRAGHDRPGVDVVRHRRQQRPAPLLATRVDARSPSGPTMRLLASWGSGGWLPDRKRHRNDQAFELSPAQDLRALGLELARRVEQPGARAARERAQQRVAVVRGRSRRSPRLPRAASTSSAIAATRRGLTPSVPAGYGRGLTPFVPAGYGRGLTPFVPAGTAVGRTPCGRRSARGAAWRRSPRGRRSQREERLVGRQLGDQGCMAGRAAARASSGRSRSIAPATAGGQPASQA